MTSERYDNRYKELWKLMYTYDEGDNNNHQVISYFCKRNRGDAEDIGKVVLEAPVIEYKHLLKTSEARLLLKKKYSQKRFWEGNAHACNVIANLEHYLKQAEDECCDKILLTSNEIATILGKKSKR